MYSTGRRFFCKVVVFPRRAGPICKSGTRRAGNACVRWFQIGNHDLNRVAARFGADMVDAMNALTLLLPGTAITYMGEEIGMENTNVRWDQTVDPMGRNAGPDGYRELSRDPARTPYQWDASVSAGFSSNSRPWLPVNPGYWQLNLDAQRRQRRSHYHVYKRLVELRKTPALRRGAFAGHVLSDWVYAFSRWVPPRSCHRHTFERGPARRTVYTRSPNERCRRRDYRPRVVPPTSYDFPFVFNFQKTVLYDYCSRSRV